MVMPLVAADAPVVLPLTVNEVNRGEVPAIVRDSDIVLRVEDLDKAGLTGPMWQRLMVVGKLRSPTTPIEGAEGISLRSLEPWIHYNFNENELSLSVTVDPQLLAPTSLVMQNSRPPDIIYRHDTSTFFNYALSSSGGLNKTSLFGETGSSIGGNLLYNTFSRGASGRFNRELTNYTLDNRAGMRRWTFGDTTAFSDALGGSALVGGVTVSRNFGLDPYFVRYPSVDFRGTALTPSRVDIYVNGILVGQQDVPPGPFDLRNLPVTSGSGSMQLVIHDAFGRERVESSQYYYSTGILSPGLSEYSYSAGFVRGNFGTKNFDYGDPAAVAFHRYGLTDRLTVGGRAEASKQLFSAGPSMNAHTFAGDTDLNLAFSTDRGHRGGALLLGHRYFGRLASLGFVYQHSSRDYANLSQRIEVDRAIDQASAFVSFLIRRGSVALQVASTTTRDAGSSRRASVFSSMSLTQRTSVYATAGVVDQGGRRRGEYSAGVSVYTGFNTTANIATNHSNGQSDVVVDLQRSLPAGTGYGYRFRGRTSAGEQTGTGSVQYQTSFGRYELGFDPLHPNRDRILSAAGGMVYEGGDLTLTRPVQDSFALVRVPGVDNVRVYVSNQLIGRTDDRGDLLVPSLLSYYGNRIRIEDKDIPLDYEVAATERTIAPPYRGGALVEFPVRRVQTVGGTAVVQRGSTEIVPAYGEITLKLEGKTMTSPLGGGAEFYLENITPGAYEATIEYSGGTCSFTLNIPATKEPFARLGKVACVEKKSS